MNSVVHLGAQPPKWFFDAVRRELVDAVDPATGLGTYSGESQEQLAARHKTTVVMVGWAEAQREQLRKYITPPVATTHEYFVEVARGHAPIGSLQSGSCQGEYVDCFCIDRQQYGQIGNYLVRVGDRYFKFQDYLGMKAHELLEKIRLAGFAV